MRAKTGNSLTDDATELVGEVVQLYSQKPTFSAGRIRSGGKTYPFRVPGYVREGSAVRLFGEWQDHSKYGRQFAASGVVEDTPTDAAGLAKWLSWRGSHIGPIKAHKLIDRYREKLMDAMTSDAVGVARFAGIPVETVQSLAAEWREESAKSAELAQLAALGLTQSEAESLMAWTTGVAQLIRNDPYIVMGRLDGFGWSRADGIAAKLDITGADPRRLRGAVMAVVRDQRQNGSTAVHLEIAVESAAQKAEIGLDAADAIRSAVCAAVADEQLCLIDSYLSTPGAYRHEKTLWEAFSRSRERNPNILSPDPQSLAERYREGMSRGKSYTLDESQIAAVAAAASHRIAVITGGAGAGKTLVASAIAKLHADGDVPVMLAAPTGKAARRLTQVLGREAETIHRLLEYRGGTFQRHRDNPLSPGCLIVDEASMIDAELAYRLFDAVGPGMSVVLIGDPNQLPPVGPGALLRDVLTHNLAPIVRLEKCHRQAGTLKTNCNAILRAVVEPWAVTEPDPCPWIVSRKGTTPGATLAIVRHLYTDHLAKLGYDPISDTQFMTAMHKGPLGTSAINALLQHLHQTALGNPIPAPDGEPRRPEFHVGDKVIQTKNDYDLNVMNGTLGIVLNVKPLIVDYGETPGVVAYGCESPDDVSLGYCLTPHKMQGSEVPCAVVLVPKQHSFMQSRSWLYTAATRAQRTCILIGDEYSLQRAAERVEIDRRVTLLDVFAANGGAA